MNSQNFTTSIFVCEISIIYWMIQTFITPIALFFYITVFYVIIRFKEDFKNSYYTLVLALSVTDLVTVLYLLHGFICCYFNYNYLGITFDRIITYIYESVAYYSMLHLTVVMSINRLTAIILYKTYKQIWSPDKTLKIVVVCFVAGCLMTLLQYVLVSPTIYHLERKSPLIKNETWNSTNWNKFDFLWSCGLALFVLTIYAAIVVISFVRKYHINKIRVKHTRELKMTCQGVLVFVTLTFGNMSFYFRFMGDLTFVISALMSAVFNPFIYITMNENIRKKVLQLFKCKFNSPVDVSSNMNDRRNLEMF